MSANTINYPEKPQRDSEGAKSEVYRTLNELGMEFKTWAEEMLFVDVKSSPNLPVKDTDTLGTLYECDIVAKYLGGYTYGFFKVIVPSRNGGLPFSVSYRHPETGLVKLDDAGTIQELKNMWQVAVDENSELLKILYEESAAEKEKLDRLYQQAS